MSLSLANPSHELQFAKSAPQFGHWDRLHNLIRSLWPVKTSAHLAHAARISQRAAELSLAERRQFASDTVVALLDTDHGPDILMALLEHSERPWVKDFKKLWQIEKLRREQAELQKRIDALSK